MSESDRLSSLNFSCPMPQSRTELIRLGHGSGGKLSEMLLNQVFLPHLNNDILRVLEDAAVVPVAQSRIAITTDSFVVSPIFFPGGDIGSLCVHGTVNDLAMRGARPLYLAASFILEEGLAISELENVVRSLANAAEQCNVAVVCGDTKVVNRGAADKIFITTTGIGIIERGNVPSANAATPGDVIIVSGDIGRHGIAVMCAREQLQLETDVISDSAPLHQLVGSILDSCPTVTSMRDLTRGGLATVLCEIAECSNVGIEVKQKTIPISPEVNSVCELLGFDPLYVACEGRLVLTVPEEDAEEVLSAMRLNKNAKSAAIIGRITDSHATRVVLTTLIGGHRMVDKLSGDQLPRIC